jgi:hypothetical protein
MLRFIRARTWLSFLVVAWGAVQLSMGFIPTWGFLVLCRVLLGGLEVRLSWLHATQWSLTCLRRDSFQHSFLSRQLGIYFLCSSKITNVTWLARRYTRHELQKRFVAMPLVTFLAELFSRLSAFFVLSISIGGFGAILAYFLSLLDNRMGISGWAWIFVRTIVLHPFGPL